MQREEFQKKVDMFVHMCDKKIGEIMSVRTCETM